MLLFGVIGHPLAHTLSPVLHNWGFSQCGVQAALYAWDTPPEKLADLIASARLLPIHGLCVTIPHKEAILPFLDGLTDSARAVGAANTVFWQEGALWGDNTDVDGFMSPLEEMGATPGNALVLGSGGAARAAIYGLTRAGWNVKFTSRAESRARALTQACHAGYVAWKDRHDAHPDLLVNTTPLGMSGPFQGLSPWKASLQGMLVYDVVYNPRRTPLLLQALREKSRVVYGLDMFVHQALAQFARWTGQRFPVDGAVRVLEEELARRQKADVRR